MGDAFEESEEVMRALRLNVNAWNTRVIVQEAIRCGIAVQRAGPQGGVKLTHDGRTHRWRNAITSLNSRLVKRVVGYKDVASRLLRSQDLPALENAVFVRGEEVRAWRWAQPFQSSVIKPRDAKRGVGVQANLSSRAEFLRAFRRVAEEHGSVLVEKYQNGSEYRFLVVDGRVIGVMERRPASVVGDGSATIAELVRAKNQDRGRIHKKLNLGEAEVKVLSRQGLHASTVPDDGRRVFLRNALNLHFGGDAVEASGAVTAEEVQVMERAAQAIPGARLLGIDALVPREDGDDEIGIIELNAAPLISMHHFPWEGEAVDIAGPVVRAMFPGMGTSRPR